MEAGLQQEAFHFRVEPCSADAEEADAAAEFLEELLSGLAVHHFPEGRYPVHEPEQGSGGELGQNGTAIYLFYNKGYGQYRGGAHLREGTHQDRGGGGFLDVVDAGSGLHREEQAHTALEGVGQGQQGQPHVPVEARADILGGPEVGAEVAVAEHHALGAAGGAGGVDDCGQVVGLDLLL